MALVQFLSDNKNTIGKQWFEKIARCYPEETARFLLNVKNSFANPVGQSTYRAVGDLLDALIEDADVEEFERILDDVVRIRAVQQLKPSQATVFVYLLKTTIREQLFKTKPDRNVLLDLLEFESKIDTLALMCFDVYCGCRDEVARLKQGQAIEESQRMLERAEALSAKRRKHFGKSPETTSSSNLNRGEGK